MNAALRTGLLWTAFSVTALFLPSTIAQAPAAPPEVFKQAPLPYAYDALEPVIDARTMELHYSRHHKAQYDALNAIAAQNPDVARMNIEQLLASTSRFPAAVRNNAGGIWNHDFFWQIMAPADRRGTPSPALMARIAADFGSLQEMQRQFNQAGGARFGSGWAWLIVRDRKLVVTSTPNQDNPLMDVAEVRGTPIIGNDVWEHAYYLKYQNRRPDYLNAFWNVVNWDQVAQNYASAKR